MRRLRDPKTKIVSDIIREHHLGNIGKLLVVGCGTGVEAAILAQCLDADVYGIDIHEDFDPVSASYAKLEKGNAMALKFEEESFDFVYSYHALEHITDPGIALREMSRVLKPDGGYWVGTPNRLRLLGYMGSKDATGMQKLKWNMADWKARCTGKFRNELGAHAGFSKSELHSMLAAVFPAVEDMSDTYFQALYQKYLKLLRFVSITGLSALVYPSIYFMGRK